LRNVEVMWLTGRLTPDHKTIANFRKEDGEAIKQVCVQFIELCRLMGVLTPASVAIDGSKFKAVNTRDKNFTRAKVERRRAQLEKSVARYLAQLDTADLQEPSEELAAKTAHLKEKLVRGANERMERGPQLEAEARQKSGQNDVCLHHRKVRADANARSRAEWKIKIAIASAHGLR
jgi:hypothetical protein